MLWQIVHALKSMRASITLTKIYYTRIPNDWFLECYGHAKPYYRGHEEPSHGWCKDERICAVPIDQESSEMSNDY